MKYLIGLLLLISFNSLGDVEVGVGYDNVNVYVDYNDEVEYNLPMLTGSIAYVTDDNIGFKFKYGKGVGWGDDGVWSTEVENLFSYTIFYRFNFEEVDVDVGLGKTDYTLKWRSGEWEPDWSPETDSDWSFHSSVKWEMYKGHYISFNYDNYYRKEEEGKREYTNSIGVEYIYKF